MNTVVLCKAVAVTTSLQVFGKLAAAIPTEPTQPSSDFVIAAVATALHVAVLYMVFA